MYRNGRQGKSQSTHGFSVTRATLIFRFFLLCYAALLGHMAYIQVVQHKKYSDIAIDTQLRPVKTSARRGRILDRNGVELATNVSGYSVSVRPGAIKEMDLSRDILTSIVRIDGRRVEELLAWPGPVLAASWIPKEDGDRIKKIDASGVDIVAADKREYPRGREAAYLLGLTDCSGRGWEGIEAEYDKELAAKPGMRRGLVAGLQTRLCFIPGFETEEVAAEDGHSITLTIDSRLQRIAECRLAEGMKRCNAKRGMALMMNPTTGEILALACTPSPDPNDRSTLNKDTIPGYVGIWDAYEPGSTLKPFTVAAALETGVIGANSQFACGGTYRIGKRTIHCHVDDPGASSHGAVNPRKIIVKSCNIGVSQVAQQVGARSLYDMLRKFGYGESTGSDLPKERSPKIESSDDWSEIRLANIGFGQGIMVTPLQLVAAYSVFANGGVLMEPHCVLRIEDSEGNPVLTRTPKERRRVISPEVARMMREFLQGVVDEGTGRMTVRMDAYTAGGKTGTAQKAGPRGYYNAYVASFVGFAPATAPRFTLLVVYDEPKNGHYGSQVAGPVWKAIAEDTLRCMKVLPDRPAAETVTGQVSP